MKVIVLVSGGIDSTVALWWARSMDWSIVPMTMDYQGRPNAERLALKRILRVAGIRELIKVHLAFLKEAEDLIREGAAGKNLETAPGGYIPARNMIFYSIAAHYAEAIGADAVIGGHNAGDPEDFPDSSKRFFAIMERLYETGLLNRGKRNVRIILPLAGMDKVAVLRAGHRLGAPLSLAWSCNRDGRKPCGRCGSCRERIDSYKELGIKDRRAPPFTPKRGMRKGIYHRRPS